MNGQVYHLCIKLTLHKAEDCRLEKKGEQQKEDKTQQDDGLKLSVALAAFEDDEKYVE